MSMLFTETQTLGFCYISCNLYKQRMFKQGLCIWWRHFLWWWLSTQKIYFSRLFWAAIKLPKIVFCVYDLSYG